MASSDTGSNLSGSGGYAEQSGYRLAVLGIALAGCGATTTTRTVTATRTDAAAVQVEGVSQLRAEVAKLRESVSTLSESLSKLHALLNECLPELNTKLNSEHIVPETAPVGERQTTLLTGVRLEHLGDEFAEGCLPLLESSHR